MTTGQKILKAITFGAIDPNKKKKRPAQQQKKQTAPEANSQQQQAKQQAKKKKTQKIHEVTSARLYVGNLDYDAAESDLEDLFRGVGNVLSAEVVINSRTQQSKGFAFASDAAFDALEIAAGSDDWMGAFREIETLRDMGVFSNLELLRMWTEVAPRIIFPQRAVGCLDPGWPGLADTCALPSAP